MMWAWNDSGWGLFWMLLTMIVFWGTLAAIITMVLRSNNRQTPGRNEIDATEALRRRFADGEISEEEYKERLRVLDESRR
jgi:putative membrane protein